ncbi:sigma-70 family RNA polymerase sigma factor [Paenibacillus sp. Marseille-Q4541]|uniref:RNA polymerase sigma factor n=1 Tax=Paenibacillus sp. Marseille-Q4541 TaxID=2831522 RepID=UPI001BAA42BA|nr:sigma-70 family RNA polymerase sigma factor [Paenibacillus sp. Marseille-Q4541]
MSNAIHDYQKELKRIAWRLQYRARAERQRELPLKTDILFITGTSPEQEIESKMFVEYILGLIPSDTGQKVIRLFYLEDRSEAEIASKLNISQQAVNKWRRKTIQSLSKKMSS